MNYPKYWDIKPVTVIFNCYFTVGGWGQVVTGRMANRADPDQTAPKEQSDLGLHCLLSHSCPNILGSYFTVWRMRNNN